MKRARKVGTVFFWICACILTWQPAAVSLAAEGGQDAVNTGDMVSIRVTVALEDGSVLYTNDPGVAHSPALRKARGYEERSRLTPYTFISGSQAKIPGLDDATKEMHVGGKKSVLVPPEKAYGTHDPSKVVRFGRIRQVPATTTMDPHEFVARFNRFPVAGDDVPLNPYLATHVREVTRDSAVLENTVKEASRSEPFGGVEISQSGDTIRISLVPSVGAPFEVEGTQGIITSSDEATFSVDLNHPAAGSAVRLDLEVVSLVKASDLGALKLPWVEDHDSGLAEAKKEDKPAVLVLYAEWCEWCRRLMEESFADPRVKSLKDDFVWIRLNSDENPDYKRRYGQKRFPAVVMMKPDGTVIKKMEGFKDASEILRELDSETYGSTRSGEVTGTEDSGQECSGDLSS